MSGRSIEYVVIGRLLNRAVENLRLTAITMGRACAVRFERRTDHKKTMSTPVQPFVVERPTGVLMYLRVYKPVAYGRGGRL